MKSNFLVTGAGSHLGRGLIDYFYNQKDVKILATSRGFYDDLEDFKNSIIEDGGTFEYLHGIDLLSSDDVRKLSIHTDKYFKDESFNIINAAGAYWDHLKFEETPIEKDIKVINENFTTVYMVAKYLIPIMKKRKHGHFITMSCSSTLHNYPQMAPFTASKAAINSLVKSLANEFAEYGLQFNALLLTTILTERDEKLKPRGDYDSWLKPEQLGELILAIVEQKNHLLNGNAIQLFNYSRTFFWEGHLQRIARVKKNN